MFCSFSHHIFGRRADKTVYRKNKGELKCHSIKIQQTILVYSFVAKSQNVCKVFYNKILLLALVTLTFDLRHYKRDYFSPQNIH